MVDALDRRGDRRGVGARTHESVDALLDQLGGRVVLSGHEQARRGTRGGLDDDQPVALAARGRKHAQRLRERLLDALGRDEAGCEHPLPHAQARDLRPHRLALGPIAEELAAQAPDPPAGLGQRGDGQNGALLRDQPAGEHDGQLRRACLRGRQ